MRGKTFCLTLLLSFVGHAVGRCRHRAKQDANMIRCNPERALSYARSSVGTKKEIPV